MQIVDKKLRGWLIPNSCITLWKVDKKTINVEQKSDVVKTNSLKPQNIWESRRLKTSDAGQNIGPENIFFNNNKWAALYELHL